MTHRNGLSRKIVQSMTAVVMGAVLLVILGFYGFYFLLLSYSPAKFSVTDWMPSGIEWAWMALTTVTALGVAALVAIKLAKRILMPLNSVAESLRQVAQGQLSVRAVADDRSMGEAVSLVDDFNSLAGRLQHMVQEQTFWNAAIAHELRTPVTILRGRLQGLAEGVFTPDERQFRSLLSQVEGLGRLIEDLRVVGMADSGHLTLEYAETDLLAEVTSVVQLFAPNLQSAGLIPIIEIQRQWVRCDSRRICQALLALLENATRYAQPGKLRIRAISENDRYRLQVEDDGPGISEAMITTVFDAFQRGEASRTAKFAGSGLGLAVVRAIALAHSGHASCHRSPEGGTIFELDWPTAAQC